MIFILCIMLYSYAIGIAMLRLLGHEAGRLEERSSGMGRRPLGSFYVALSEQYLHRALIID